MEKIDEEITHYKEKFKFLKKLQGDEIGKLKNKQF